MSKKNRRLNPSDRRVEILNAAIVVASDEGYKHFTRAQVASQAQCAEALVSSYFGTMQSLRRTVMRAAVKGDHLAIIAQGLVANDPHAQKAAQAIRISALQSLA